MIRIILRRVAATPRHESQTSGEGLPVTEAEARLAGFNTLKLGTEKRRMEAQRKAYADIERIHQAELAAIEACRRGASALYAHSASRHGVVLFTPAGPFGVTGNWSLILRPTLPVGFSL
jgi:hypothetical protein